MFCYLLWRSSPVDFSVLFFFNPTATTEIYTLSLHDALPICARLVQVGIRTLTPHQRDQAKKFGVDVIEMQHFDDIDAERSEEHTSELQSHVNLVCRLLLEKKKNNRPAQDKTKD